MFSQIVNNLIHHDITKGQRIKKLQMLQRSVIGRLSKVPSWSVQIKFRTVLIKCYYLLFFTS